MVTEPEQPNTEQQQRGLAKGQRGKVRTGCVTCKTRRVKCDEKKPHCRRCIESRSVHVCGGYSPRNLSKRQPDKPSALSKLLPRTSGSLLYGSGLATGFSKDPDERRYFYLFQQHTSELLSGYFETEFWSSIVPQAAHELPCIRHAVVAISALLKATQVSTRPTLALDSLKQKETEYEYAISQYSRAISSLKLLLSSKLSDGSHYKIALITAICFIAIENLQGDLPTASRNMAGALSIAIEPKPDYVQCLKNRGGIPDYNAIDDELLAVFVDLDMQTTLPSFYGVNYFSYGMPLVLVSLPCMPSPEIPTEFPNIGAAKTALMQIHALLTRLHSQSPHHLASKTTSSNEYKGLLDQWKTAFAPLFQQAQDIFTASYDWPADPKAYIPFFILSSNHALATIIACTNAGNCPEMFYDNMMPEFQRIINYSEIIVDALCSRSPSIFTFEVGVLPPLYVAGAKCRDPKLRRKAIALMRQCPSQEGVWQGSGSAQICEWVMEIEEIGAVNGRYGSEKAPPDYAASIPESDRVKWSSMKCGLRERRVTATRTAMVSVVQGSHRLWERSFTW